jgi:preprotein translocase subunit SecG
MYKITLSIILIICIILVLTKLMHSAKSTENLIAIGIISNSNNGYKSYSRNKLL